MPAHDLAKVLIREVIPDVELDPGIEVPVLARRFTPFLRLLYLGRRLLNVADEMLRPLKEYLSFGRDRFFLYQQRPLKVFAPPFERSVGAHLPHEILDVVAKCKSKAAADVVVSTDRYADIDMARQDRGGARAVRNGSWRLAVEYAGPLSQDVLDARSAW